MLGRLHSNMALLAWCHLGKTVCPYMAALSHGAEFRGRQRSCTQSMVGATVGPAVGCEVKG